MIRIICSDDVDKGVHKVALVAKMDDRDNPKQAWIVRVRNNKVERIDNLAISKINSFYAHSNGMTSCDIPCPDYIKGVIKDA